MRRRALFFPMAVAVIQIVGTHMAAWRQGVDLTVGTVALLLAGPALLIFRRRSPDLAAAGCAALSAAAPGRTDRSGARSADPGRTGKNSAEIVAELFIPR
ncbi:hypothetical protein ACTXM3_14375 [Glutamicibacter arilaitensis]|uniref:hypothetical protein n=1 Tax=Glutamicibacter arilaitensis TaxID=256701 RepID=UPI003F91F66D